MKNPTFRIIVVMLLLAKLSYAESSSHSSQGYFINTEDKLSIFFGGLYLRSTVGINTPMIDLQLPLFSNGTLGIGGAFYNDGSSLSFLAPEASVNFYSIMNYAGLWIHAGAAEYIVNNLTLGTTSLGTAVRGLLGWRWHSKDTGGSFGLALGPEYLIGSGLSVAVRFDLGIDFLLGDIFN